MRVGESLRPMTEDTLRRIFAEGSQDFLLRAALSDVSGEDVQRLLYTGSFFDLMKFPHPATRDAMLQRLEQEHLVMRHGSRWHITNLGALLFAKNLRDFDLQRKGPRVIVYRGTNKLETVRDHIGNRGYAAGFQSLLGFIDSQLPANEVIGQALRTTTRMYPEIAIRELVANALVHQDIEDSSSFIMVEIFVDRIEISNPGAPLVEPDRFIDKVNSRNERLTDIMRRFGICEERSSGIDKVISSAEFYQLPAPEFRATEQRTIAVLFAHKHFRDMERSERIRACYQHACLCYVNNKRMTNQSLRERFKLPEHKVDAISRIIADAVADGFIKSDDPENTSRRYAKYIPYWG